MSRWPAIEEFLHGPTARWIVRGLVGYTIYGIGSDYYCMRHYHAFPIEEAQRWVVNSSGVGRPRPILHVLPSAHCAVYSPWTPRNGDTVLARDMPENPHWIQLIGGRYMERDTCGVNLCVLESEYLAHHEKEQEEIQKKIAEEKHVVAELQKVWSVNNR